MRGIVAFVALTAGCASPKVSSRAPHPAPPASDVAPPRETRAEPDVASFDAIAAEGAADVTLMRELVRLADATHGAALPVLAVDGCVRAIVATSSPTARVWFEDEAHSRRGEAGTNGLVPPRGPVCARRGESLRLVVDAPDARVARAIVWQSP